MLATVSQFKQLLVPHDFSPHSDRALQLAIGLAKKTGAHIRLLHVFESPQAAFEPYGILPLEPHLIEIPQAARERLQQELDRVLKAGVEGEAFVREGRAVAAILAEIASSGADLVVMGSHGSTGLTHALLGSVAERTIRLAPIPVLTVKEESPA
jgi:nucleotide-binding universal stress UspA family protein